MEKRRGGMTFSFFPIFFLFRFRVSRPVPQWSFFIFVSSFRSLVFLFLFLFLGLMDEG